jgi:hypothetical protein
MPYNKKILRPAKKQDHMADNYLYKENKANRVK